MATGFEDLGATAAPVQPHGFEDLGAVREPAAPSPAAPVAQASDFSDLGAIPAAQHYANLASDSNFEPASAVAQGSVDPETGFQVQKLRDARPLSEKIGAGLATAVNPATWGNAAKGVGQFAIGLGAAPLNMLGQFWHGGVSTAARAVGANDLADSEAQKQLRDKAEAVLAGQNVEESLRGAGRTLMNLRPKTGAMDISGSPDAPLPLEDPEEQAKADAEANELRARSEFQEKVDAAKKGIQLSQGRPLQTGVVSAITGATGTPVSQLTPEALASVGAPPVRQGMIEAEAAAANPENLALAAAPELPGAQYLGGKLAQGAGKAMQIPGRVISAIPGKIGKAATGVGAAGVEAGLVALHNPAAAAGLAAGVGGAKGLQWLGQGIEQQGAAAAAGVPSALDTAAVNARMAGQSTVGTNAQRVIGDAATRAASTAIGMAPANALLSGGDPEEFAKQEVGAATFGGAADLLRSSRPALVEAARPALRQQGIASQDLNTREGRASAQFIESLPDAQKNTTYELQGVLQGLPVPNGQGEMVPSRMLVQSNADYQATLPRLGMTAPSDGGQGFFWGPDGTAYINGEHSSFSNPENAAQVMGHEFAGHAAVNMLKAAGAKGGPIYEGLINSAKANLYRPDGTPTPEFQRFVNGYNKAFDPTGQHQQIDVNDPNSVEEFLAETAGRIISQKGAADIAVPKNILDKVTDGVGSFMSRLTGVDPRSVGTGGRFDRTEVAKLSGAVRDSLFQLAGMKQEGGEITRPQTPEEYIQELQDTLAKPRPTDTAENVKAWVKEQAQARKDLADFQGQQPTPTTPAASPQPAAPSPRDDAVKAMVAMGIKPAEAAQHVDTAVQALGGTPSASDILTAATRSRAGVKAKPSPPNVQPVSATATQPIPEGAGVAAKITQPVATAVAPVQDETPADVAVGPQPVVPKDPPEKIAADAEQAAIAQEKNGRANTGAAKKRVQDAKVQALAEAGKENPNDLHVATDSLGAKTLVGDINPENPYHAAILKELGITPDQIKGVTDAQALNGTPAYIRYRSAKSDTEGTGGEGSAGSIGSTGKRQEEIEANPAQDRKESTIQHKVAIPLDTGITKDGGVKKRFLVLSDLLHNAQSIFEWMKSKGVENPYGATPGEQEQGLAADAQAYARNHANGWKGDGSAPMQGFPDSAFPTRDPNYQPAVIPKDRFDVLNMMFNDEKAVKVGDKQQTVDEKLQRVNDAKTPGAKKTAQGVYDRALKALRESEELKNLNRENGAFYDPNTNETNELRNTMKASGFDPAEKLYPVIQNLAPQHILGVSDSPIPRGPGDVDSIRPSGFDVDPAELAKEGLPNRKAIQAGFSPTSAQDKLTPERLMVNIRNNGPNRISAKATKDYSQAISDHLGGGESSGGSSESPQSTDDQSRSIIKWADENGVAIRRRPWNLNPTSPNNKGGVEHDAFFDAPSQQWIKTTKLGQYGVWPSVYRIPTTGEGPGELSWTMSKATPEQYLQRLKGAEELFGIKTPVHGVIVEPTITGKPLPSLVTSQPNIQGDTVNDGQIESILKSKGFLKIDDGSASYYRPSDNTALLDAHPGNMKMADGDLVGYDSIVMHPDGELRSLFERDHTKASARTAAPKTDRALPSFAEAMGETPEKQAVGFSPSEETGRPEDGVTPGDKLAREAENAGVVLKVDDYKKLMTMDPATIARIRSRIEQNTGKAARFSPSEIHSMALNLAFPQISGLEGAGEYIAHLAEYGSPLVKSAISRLLRQDVPSKTKTDAQYLINEIKKLTNSDPSPNSDNAARFSPDWDKRPVVNWPDDFDEKGNPIGGKNIEGLSPHEQAVHWAATVDYPEELADFNEAFGKDSEHVKNTGEFVREFQKNDPSTWKNPDSKEAQRYQEIVSAMTDRDYGSILDLAGDTAPSPDDLNDPDREEFEDGAEGEQEYQRAVSEYKEQKQASKAAVSKAIESLKKERTDLKKKALDEYNASEKELSGYVQKAKDEWKGIRTRYPGFTNDDMTDLHDISDEASQKNTGAKFSPNKSAQSNNPRANGKNFVPLASIQAQQRQRERSAK